MLFPKGGLCYTTSMHTRVSEQDSWWRAEWGWLSYVIVFVASFSVLLVLQSAPVFADPDSFYHVKMAELIRDEGVVRSFPWLQLTTLGEHYTDQHFLYHILLIPFVTIFPPLIGMKVATVMFGSALFVVMYWFLRSFGVRWAIAWPLILLFIRPFTFRISLAKAPSTSLILLVIGLAWVFRYQLRRLFWLGFIYVWYYGGFALLGVVAALYAGTSTLVNRLRGHMPTHRFLQNLRSLVRPRGGRQKTHSLNWLLLASVTAGLAAGLIFNPYFPQNIWFYEQQLIHIGIINLRDVIGVGAEWYPYQIGELVANAAFASLLLLLALVGIAFRARAQSKQSWTLLVLTIFFFLLTLKSRRYVEYYVPVAVIFSAFSISDALKGNTAHWLWIELKSLVLGQRWAKYAAAAVGLYVVLAVGYVAGRDFAAEKNDLQSGYRLTELQAASTWLASHTPAGSRVVHSDWDEFPILFYHNAHNTYIAGLDPTFLYQANQDVYWTWVNITLGKYDGDIYQAVTKKLGSQYVFLTNDHTGMERLIRADDRFKQVYRDAEATIFAVETAPIL